MNEEVFDTLAVKCLRKCFLCVRLNIKEAKMIGKKRSILCHALFIFCYKKKKKSPVSSLSKNLCGRRKRVSSFSQEFSALSHSHKRATSLSCIH